ncbi:Threonine--tRNA ligase, mitochondrial [Manis javanica]|nr:Threonine--tRNA ligase, mitochondrial [Manis javanica]
MQSWDIAAKLMSISALLCLSRQGCGRRGPRPTSPVQIVGVPAGQERGLGAPQQEKISLAGRFALQCSTLNDSPAVSSSNIKGSYAPQEVGSVVITGFMIEMAPGNSSLKTFFIKSQLKYHLPCEVLHDDLHQAGLTIPLVRPPEVRGLWVALGQHLCLTLAVLGPAPCLAHGQMGGRITDG